MEKFIKANGIELAYQEFGDQTHPAMLLIMGLGAQMIYWPEAFCQGLADRGYHVIRFDNRDVGLSHKLEGEKPPGFFRMIAGAKLKLDLKAPYDLNDMANDALGLLDALNIDRAHIVGASMGGVIAQLISGHFPSRVLSLTSIMSTSGGGAMPKADSKVTRQVLLRARSTSREDVIKHGMKAYRMIGSPGYQSTDEELQNKVLAAFNRAHYPAGFMRHLSAIYASGDRIELLKKIEAPTLVIHGKEDPLVPLEAGVDTARHISGAKIELIDGMGHDMPGPLLPKLVELIASHADMATNES